MNVQETTAALFRTLPGGMFYITPEGTIKGTITACLYEMRANVLESVSTHLAHIYLFRTNQNEMKRLKVGQTPRKIKTFCGRKNSKI